MTCQAPQVQHAEHVVDVVLVDGQARVLAVGEHSKYFVHVVVDVQADDLVARHHDVVDGDVFQVEHPQQHVLVLAGNARALVDHGAQLVR